MAEEEPIETRIKEACLQAAGNARVDHCRMAYVLKIPSDVQMRLYKNNPPQTVAPPGYASLAQFWQTKRVNIGVYNTFDLESIGVF